VQIIDITVKKKPPIQNFEVSNLSSIVVLAGPNGIGKTRLIQEIINLLKNPRVDQSTNVKIRATSQGEVKQWGKDTLSTLDNSDLQKLITHLHRKQKRGGWTSSIVYLDSFRTFEKIKPFQWSWNFGDPFDEEIGWDVLFNPFAARFQDTIQALYKKLGHYRTAISQKYEELRKAGQTQMPIDPADPLKKFKEAFNLLLSPKELTDIPLGNPSIQYLDSGQLLAIESLSSGEREVFTTVFDLLLHEPSDCVVFFDEPEMHLHPELSFRLLRTLQSVGERNQFIFCTHSPDIITESLSHSVIFIKPPDGDKNQVLCVEKEDEKATALNLLGQNLGVIALGRKIVLIEGLEASLDRQTYGEIIGSGFPQFVLVPSGARQTILSFSKIIEDVLSKAIWGIDFFMISDGDSNLPDQVMKELVAKSSGRLAFLPRYHLENYFLDENIISQTFEEMESEGSWLRDPKQIRERLKQIAKESLPYTINLWLGSSLRSKVGEIEVSIKGVDGMNLDDYTKQLEEPILKEHKRIGTVLSTEEIKKAVEARWRVLARLIEEDKEDWKKLIPGRVICHKFASIAGISSGRFKTMYINTAKEAGLTPFNEIINIFKSFESIASK
jgi:ABC-type cobalamin/Fe3+-siderophores transport system ATPase subunit